MKILSTYQQQAGLAQQKQSPKSAEFAVIGAYNNNTHKATLIFPGAVEPSGKEYRCNTAFEFTSGQKVKICKTTGQTYLVEYPLS